MQELPEVIKKHCFNSFSVLNESERAVILYGEEAYRKSLDLYNDDAECWKMPSGETYGFVGWNPQCIPNVEYIVWKLDRLEKIKRGEIKDGL